MSTSSSPQSQQAPENPPLDSGSGETFTKDEAAQFLGVSSRALERYTAAGRLSVGYQRGKTRSVAVYERAELERLQSELQRPLLRGVPVEAFPPPTTETPTTPTQTATNLVAEEDSTEFVEIQNRKAPATPTNSDNATSQELASASSKPAGEASAGAAGTTLDALAQLILERLIERARGEAASSGASAGTALMLASVAPVVLKAPHAALGEKLLLSLAEASALTGLSRAFLKAAIGDGALAAKPIGRLWRVKRADLDAFIAAL
jgi:excisionase family DNA binding protein